jgi:hypothetical protein
MACRKPEPLRLEEKKQLNNLIDGLMHRLSFTPPLLQDDDLHPKVVVEIHQQLRLHLSEVKRPQPDDPLVWAIRRAIDALRDLPENARPAQIQEGLETRFGKGYFDPK